MTRMTRDLAEAEDELEDRDKEEESRVGSRSFKPSLPIVHEEPRTHSQQGVNTRKGTQGGTLRANSQQQQGGGTHTGTLWANSQQQQQHAYPTTPATPAQGGGSDFGGSQDEAG